ncbi:hypothetical protein ACNFJ7_06265 [Sphingomonas sp. HT-1]|uniref:hypothetical protein n=1 Tax=unclassified Sphingomonas TaxID=196159 RepID=UPI0002DEE5A2|nr:MULTISPECIES: hypothetical protein [unclassified Sphingomonas]KTF69587.1 hypothetical protein ATB93_08390 [Sphingomonas sp. WG]
MVTQARALVGLVFAVEEALDRPGALVGSLPFGGMTLLEYQVRLLAGIGAEQVLVAAGRVTPAFLAAIERAGRGQLAIEIVRSAEEAAEKVLRDADVLVLADGLVTIDPVMERMAAEPHNALLVTDDAESPAAIERLDMRHCWAGIARIQAAHLAQIATMPEDYDFQSALLRVAAQSGALQVPLAPVWARAGHAVERSAQGLAERNDSVLAALSDRRTLWADRWVFSRAARYVLPQLMAREIPDWAPLIAGGVLGAGSVVATFAGWQGIGVCIALLAALALATGAAHAALRGEEPRARGIEAAVFVLFALVVLANGWRMHVGLGTAASTLLALGTLVAQLLAERVPVPRRRWWANASAQLLILTPFAIAGFPLIGLAVAQLYAVATLAAAIEAVRHRS